MTPGSLQHVRRDPRGCSRWLSAPNVVHEANITVALHDATLTVFDVLFAPPPREHLPGYPTEHARVTVLADGRTFSVPADPDDRAWLHRYPRWSLEQILSLPIATGIPWEYLLGSLCLEYPDDPDHLRWQWGDGFDAYMRIVQRHLWFEEYWRRHGDWPVEDAPHGNRPDGRPHAIASPAFRRAA